MDAAYFNPKSIHIAKAEASRETDATKVFIELRDMNYPAPTIVPAQGRAQRADHDWFAAQKRF